MVNEFAVVREALEEAKSIAVGDALTEAYYGDALAALSDLEARIRELQTPTEVAANEVARLRIAYSDSREARDKLRAERDRLRGLVRMLLEWEGGLFLPTEWVMVAEALAPTQEEPR